jgi:hypothetical protein
MRSLCWLLLAAFCGYGFAAAHEPGVSPGWKIGYAVVGITALTAGFLTLRRG